MARYTISRETTDRGGRYVVNLGLTEAVLTYSISSPTMLIAERLELGGAIRGGSLPAAIVAQLVADARTEGRRIIALCPIVKDEAQKNPAYAEIFSWE